MRLFAMDNGGSIRDLCLAVPDPDSGTGYMVEIHDGAPARCNPVNQPPGRNSAGL